MESGQLAKVCRITMTETITSSPNMIVDIPCTVHEANHLNKLVSALGQPDKLNEQYATGAFLKCSD